MKPAKLTALLAFVALVAAPARAEYRDHRGRKVDSLEAVLASGAQLSDRERMVAYLDLMAGYRNTDGRRTEHYARQALALSYTMGALNARESALYNLGLTAYGRDDFGVAVDYFQQALAVTDSMRGDSRYTETDIDDNLSQLYGALGNLYNLQDQALLAIEYYQRALPIFERHGWKESQCILYHNVAELYLSMGNDEKAEENYLRAIDLGEATGDSLMMALPRKGLVKIYIGDSYERAAATVMPAYHYYRAHQHEEPSDYADVLASLTRLNLMDGHRDVKAAKAYADEALTFADKDLMSETLCDIYAAATEVAVAQKDWHQALQYGLRSVHPEGEETFSDVGCYQLLATISNELGDKQATRSYINKVCALMNRFATEYYQSGISQMEVLYETQKKETAIRQLDNEKRLLMRSSIWGGAALLLLALLFFVLWRSVVLRRKNATMQAKIDGEMAERLRIARDLHDRMGGLLTAVRQSAPPASKTTQLVDKAIAEMRHVAHHLLPDSLRRYGLRAALSDYCQTMKNVSFAFVGEEQRLKRQHEELLYGSTYELVNNAVRSAGADHIRVQLVVGDDYTAVNVSDDGNGRATLDSSEGTGLRSIKERVEAVGGRFDLYASPGQGTEVNIELPNRG